LKIDGFGIWIEIIERCGSFLSSGWRQIVGKRLTKEKPADALHRLLLALLLPFPTKLNPANQANSRGTAELYVGE
jgi:hypothetical protein